MNTSLVHFSSHLLTFHVYIPKTETHKRWLSTNRRWILNYWYSIAVAIQNFNEDPWCENLCLSFIVSTCFGRQGYTLTLLTMSCRLVHGICHEKNVKKICTHLCPTVSPFFAIASYVVSTCIQWLQRTWRKSAPRSLTALFASSTCTPHYPWRP